jgi:hypothetical protein
VSGGEDAKDVDATPTQVDRRTGRFRQPTPVRSERRVFRTFFEEQADDRELPVRGLVDEVRFEGV